MPGGWLSDRYGPRGVLTLVVSLWSIFTGLTGAAWNFLSMTIFRFLFGAGEAGAFPGIARSVYSWIPMKERGIVQGINFSGSRLGAAVALPLVALMISKFGWRISFTILAGIGILWAFIWYLWFRNDPSEHPRISPEELDYITENRQKAAAADDQEVQKLSPGMVLSSRNMWLAMIQYFSSNFTFFFCLGWALPFIKEHFELELVNAGFLASIPLYCGALGNWFSGWLVDRIYRSGRWELSRRIPAIIGFTLATLGLVIFVFMQDVYLAVAFLSVAIFGADMTLSPSWSFCIDIGRKNAGTISGTMNMAGNIGSFITGLAFPYLTAWTGSEKSYFILAAVLNVAAIVVWMLMKPNKSLEEY